MKKCRRGVHYEERDRIFGGGGLAILHAFTKKKKKRKMRPSINSPLLSRLYVGRTETRGSLGERKGEGKKKNENTACPTK